MSYIPQSATFEKAIPVWATDRETELNLWLSFRTVAMSGTKTILRLTGSTAYDVKVNGTFVAFGPAKCGHGYYRVDELDLTPYIAASSVITVTVAGYNCSCGSYINSPSFLCAELIEDDKITAATGHDGFLCREMTEHEQKVLRYSNQRTFTEVYRMTPEISFWEQHAEIFLPDFSIVSLTPTEQKCYIQRGCSYHTYDKIFPQAIVSEEHFTRGNLKSSDITYPSYMRPGSTRFSLEEIATDSFLLSKNLSITDSVPCLKSPTDVSLTVGHALTYHWKGNTTGRITMDITCRKDATLLALFEEYITPDNELIHYGSIHNCLIWDLKMGTYTISTFEPYVLQALRLYALSGEVTVSQIYVQYFGADKPSWKYVGSDPELEKIYDAAIETYRQNTFTIFMDCPSRERAGFLCDSFFTARVEYLLTGANEVEHNFLENFFLQDTFRNIPAGMFPCCYPSESGYLQNWGMWLVIEFREYVERTKDISFRDAVRERLYKLIEYFKQFENEFGLLERLEGWVWVDGDQTECARLIQDVNYPTNMLYTKALSDMAALYDDQALTEKAEHLSKIIEEQSYMKEKDFYCDNARRNEQGNLVLSGKATETCQYYPFYFGITTPQKHPTLWRRLLEDFGPKRVITNEWPRLRPEAKWQEIFPSNMLIGNQLRFALLFQYADREQFLQELKDYYLRMAQLTGTLWEHDTDKRSCNHAFTSHLLCWLYELGISCGELFT